MVYWVLVFGRAYESDVAAFGCVIFLIGDVHCHSKFTCRVWSVALVSAMLVESPSAFRAVVLCFVLWKPLLAPNKKDNAKLYEELALAVQNLGRVPFRSKASGKRDEDKLRQRIDKAMKTGALTEEQYRSLTATADEHDVVRAHTKLLCEELALEVQQLGFVPSRSNDAGRSDEDNLRHRIERAKKNLPFFAEVWRRTIFEGLMLELEQCRQRRELLAQFVDSYKRGAITEEQLSSFMIELETCLR